MEVCGQFHAPAALPPEKESPGTHWVGSWGGGTQSRFGRSGGKNNSQPLTGLEPPIIQPVPQRYTTELPRLLLKGIISTFA
jgi:hypothetical protein